MPANNSMGDLIYVPWGNNNFKYIDNPTDFELDDNIFDDLYSDRTLHYEFNIAAVKNLLVLS